VFVEEIFARAGKWRNSAPLAAPIRASSLLCRGPAHAGFSGRVIFSSGSTGVPKGVMLSHYNVLSNIEAIAQLFWIGPDDRIVSGLPLFSLVRVHRGHSGFPLIAGCGVVYHTNPADAKAIGRTGCEIQGTLLLSTPTFCSMYTHKCSREEFASLPLRPGGRRKTA